MAEPLALAPLPSVDYVAAAQRNSPPAQRASATPEQQKKKSKEDDELDFLEKDIRQLSKTQVNAPAMDIKVTSVSKVESTVGRSPAAIFVITNEMILRSGATSVPELLRMAPGVEVARVNSHAWAISVRGFNGRFSNKLLVLVDGRVVYNQLYSGVYWDVQDMVLEDIDRIEVIRGPGGTLWGANAVNGVINIITKNAQQTQGALVSAGGGNLDRSINQVRAGGNNGDGLFWRVYGKHFERGEEYSPLGSDDAWRMGRGGFRLDWELDRAQRNTLTVLGDYYGGEEGQKSWEPLPFPLYSRELVEEEGVSGANVLARFVHRIDDESDWSLQAYFDQTYRNQIIAEQLLRTLDVEFQHRFPLAERHRLIWGLHYQQVHSYLPTQTFAATFDPQQRTTGLFSGFAEDTISLVEDRLAFIVGTKLENNSFTGFEYQPSGRLLWTPDDRHTGWAAISRAVRTPSLFEDDSVANLGPIPWPDPPGIAFYRIIGNRECRSEDVVAYEIGYRTQVTDRFAWDISTFFNNYDNLLWTLPGQEFDEDTYVVVPAYTTNAWYGQTYGVELCAQWDVSERWRLWGSYSFLRMMLHSQYSDEWSGYENNEGNSPINQARFYSWWDLGRSWQFDLGLRYVDYLANGNVPAYLTMDARLAWSPNRNLQIALVGQNLFDDHHLEFSPENFSFVGTEVRRTVFASVTWRR